MTISHRAEPLPAEPAAAGAAAGTEPEPMTPGWTVALAIVTVLVAGAGLVLRMRFLLSEVGFVNSDEATTGFMAFDILRGHLPVLVEGNPYGGPLESYLLAPFLAVLGPNEVLMQLGNLAVWAVATFLCFAVARMVLPRMAAVAAALVFWVSGAAMILLSIDVYAGYATGLAVYLGVFLVAGRQAEADRPSPWWALLAGFLAGTAVWLHPMFLFLVGPALVVVTVRHWRSPLRWLAPVVAGGFVALLPTIVLNAANDWFSLEQPAVIPPLSYRERLEQFGA